MLSETAFGSKKSLKNFESTPNLKVGKQAFSGDTFASKKVKKVVKKNKKRAMSALPGKAAKGNRSISKLAEVKDNKSSAGFDRRRKAMAESSVNGSQLINKFEE